jgi:hypothetical protein
MAVFRRPSKFDLLAFFYGQITIGIGNFNDKVIITADTNPGANVITEINQLFHCAFKNILQLSLGRIDRYSFRTKRQSLEKSDRMRCSSVMIPSQTMILFRTPCLCKRTIQLVNRTSRDVQKGKRTQINRRLLILTGRVARK